MPKNIARFALGLLLLAGVAFWPLYLSKSWSAIDRYTHAHAALGTIWMLMLVAQPVFVLRGSQVAHRLVGRASIFVAGSFFVSSVLLAHFRVSRMTDAAFAKEGIYIFLPLAIAFLFAVAWVLGFYWRRSTQVHARFMLSTALLLIDPLLARIMFFYFPPLPSDHLYQGITFTLIAGAMVYMVKTLPQQVPGRSWYRNYCLGTAAVFALFFAVPYTDTWLGFVTWFRSIHLT
jgi:hypothetical protein